MPFSTAYPAKPATEMGPTMKNTILRAAAALSLAAIALMAPTAANAYTDPAVVIATPSTITAGSTSTFTTDLAPYDASEEILISITGENAGGAKLAMVKTAVETNATLRTRAVQGKLNVPIAFPSNGIGTYDLTFTGVTSKVVLHSRITVVAPGTKTPSKAGLAVTGIASDDTVGLWIAGGALVVAGAAVGIGATVRRRRHTA